jgi:ferric-dicitrate binding protein FerR (iron transport regulator)
LSCGKGKKASTSAGKKVRRLWGDGKGRFRTRGKHGAATVRGTKWLTEDRCSGTLFRVKRGVVAVKDFRTKKTVLVKKGKSYLARAKGARR